MSREEIIGNVTTIGKFIFLTSGVPALVSFANSSDFAIIVAAIFGLIWAFYDSKYFNTFFNKSTKPEDEIPDHDGAAEYEELNQDYTLGDDSDGC